MDKELLKGQSMPLLSSLTTLFNVSANFVPALQVVSCIAGGFFNDWATREALRLINVVLSMYLLDEWKNGWTDGVEVLASIKQGI